MAEAAGDAGDFLSYYESQLEAYLDRWQWATFEAYRRSTGRAKLEFQQLTVPFIEGFRTYLIGHCANSKNTVHKNLASTRTILYAAIREGRFPRPEKK